MGDESPTPKSSDEEKKRAGAELRKLLDDAAWDVVMALERLVDQRVHQLFQVEVGRVVLDRKTKTNIGYTSLRNRLADSLVELLRRLHRGTRAATAETKPEREKAP